MESLKLNHNFHVFIFNWSRHHNNALKHEEELKRHGIKVTVINSSSVYHEKHWYKLDDGYFAEQWNTLLKLRNRESDFIIHIQADAHFEQNIQFIKKLDTLASKNKNIGIYAPNVDFTYHRYHFKNSVQPFHNVYSVPNTDCTYWAINNKLLGFADQLFDINQNFFGFGCDWYYSAVARDQSMMVLRDYNFTVDHEHSTGYDINKALEQLDEWIKIQPVKIKNIIHYLMDIHKIMEIK